MNRRAFFTGCAAAAIAPALPPLEPVAALAPGQGAYLQGAEFLLSEYKNFPALSVTFRVFDYATGFCPDPWAGRGGYFLSQPQL